MDHLPISTPQATPEFTAVSTTVAPPATETPSPSPVPEDTIGPDNVNRVKLLHQYWLVVSNATGIDPYDMDISAIASSPDGRYLAIGGCSKRLEEDLRSGNLDCSGKDVITSGIPFLLILDANTEKVIAIIPETKAGTTIADLAFTQDGSKLIYAVYPDKFAMWDLAAGRLDSILWEGETSAPRVAVSPDGKWVALKTTDQASIWDVSAKKVVAEIPAFYRPHFSADSSRILVYHDQEFVVYETGTWSEVKRFGTPCDCVYAFSPDLSLLATSERTPSENTDILIWDTSTGEQVQSLQGGTSHTTLLSFSPDGQMLWRVKENGDLTAWDTSDWQLLAEHIGGVIPIVNLRGFQFVEGGRHYLLFSYLYIGLYGLR